MSGLASRDHRAGLSAYLDHARLQDGAGADPLRPRRHHHGDGRRRSAAFSAGPRPGARRGRAAHALPQADRSSTEWIEGMRTNSLDWHDLRRPDRRPVDLRARQPGAVAGAVQHPGRRRRLAPARGPDRAQPRVPASTRATAPSIDRGGLQLGRRRCRAVPSSHADARELFETYPQLEQRRASSASACTAARTPTDETRFRALMSLDGAPARATGTSILFIRLLGTESAIRRFGMVRPGWHGLEDALRRAVHHQPGLGQLRPRRSWPCSTCAVIATDSGSIQEEANILRCRA